MKKSIIAITLIASVLSLISCKKKEEAGQVQEAPSISAGASIPTTEPTSVTAESKSYSVTFAPGTPETILLGKESEAAVKILNLKAIDLLNTDGKPLGIQLSYDIELTNKNVIGGKSVFLDPSTFRLELDNGTKIAHDDYESLSAEPESTKSNTGNIFKIPAGAKPIALNLYMDETRVSVKFEIN